MFNLRQLNSSEAPSIATDAGRFSQFSFPNFAVPSSRILGNIGEPLDHSQGQKFVCEGDEGEQEDDGHIKYPTYSVT